MSDEFSETSSQGWLSRLFESIKEVAVGLLLFIVAFPVLWWNEGRAVQTYKSLKEGAGAVVSVQSDKVEPSHEGNLVHVSGKAVTSATVTDPELGVSTVALKLERKVEMYQWVEEVETKKHKKVGGSEETVKTYRYKKQWSDDVHDSGSFKDPAGHQNPASMAYRSDAWRASPVTIGAFQLSDSLINRVPGEERLAVTADMLKLSAPAVTEASAEQPVKATAPRAKKGARKAAPTTTQVARGKHHVPATAAASATTGPRVVDGQIFVGASPSEPEVGNLRITYVKVPPADVSIIAAQVGNSFGPYETKAGDSLELLQPGLRPAAAMFKQAESENATLTWILRLVGFVVMALGVFLVMRPLAVVADVLPFLGDILRWGLGLVAVSVAAPFTLITIALAWMFYRPVLAIILLAAGVGAFVLVKMLATKRKAAAVAAGAPA